jgi:hypothetical protein
MTAVPVEISALIERRYDILLFAEQYSLGSHGNSGEMAAAVSERLTDDGDLGAFEAFLQVRA